MRILYNLSLMTVIKLTNTFDCFFMSPFCAATPFAVFFVCLWQRLNVMGLLFGHCKNVSDSKYVCLSQGKDQWLFLFKEHCHIILSGCLYFICVAVLLRLIHVNADKDFEQICTLVILICCLCKSFPLSRYDRFFQTDTSS